MMIEGFVVTLFGLLFGSFLNVLILRIPKEESIVFPGSHCPKCNNKLKWWHNIPVLSWVLLGGKCHFCKEKISVQYPLVEVATALIFAVVYWKLQNVPYAIIAGLVFALLLGFSVIDFRYKAVPDSLNLSALTLAIFASSDIVGNFITVLKDTTLVSIIGLFDVLGMLRSISKDLPWLGLHKEPLVFGAILFFLICFTMSKYSRHLEVKLSTDHKD